MPGEAARCSRILGSGKRTKDFKPFNVELRMNGIAGGQEHEVSTHRLARAKLFLLSDDQVAVTLPYREFRIYEPIQ
jgi:hypothetical protein